MKTYTITETYTCTNTFTEEEAQICAFFIMRKVAYMRQIS